MIFKGILISIYLFSSSAFGVDHIDYPEVFQREYILTDSKQYLMVQTYGLVTCVALSIYDPKLKLGLLAHIDARTKLTEIDKLIKNFPSKHNIQVQLNGGLKNSNFLEKIKRYIERIGYKVSSFNKNKINSSMNILFNLETGEVTNYIETVQNTSASVYYAKLDRLKWGRKLYRHAKSIGGGDSVNENNFESNPQIFFP